MKFLYELLHSGRARESAPDFDDRCRLVRSVCLEKFGPRIVDSLVRSSVFALPAYTYHDVGDVIFEIMLLDRAQVSYLFEILFLYFLLNLPLVQGSGLERIRIN